MSRRLTFSLDIYSYTKGTESKITLTTNDDGEFSIDIPNFIGEIAVDNGSVSDFDRSPDPDGDDQALGPNQRIPIRLRGNEVDADNEFIIRNGKVSGFCIGRC